MNRSDQKHLDEIYTPIELQHIATALKEWARAEPGVFKRHEFLNEMRTRVEFDDGRAEFRTYLAKGQGHPEKRDLLVWGAALDAMDAEMLMPREFTSHGVIYYAPGFKLSARASAVPLLHDPLPSVPNVKPISYPAPTAARQKQFA